MRKEESRHHKMKAPGEHRALPQLAIADFLRRVPNLKLKKLYVFKHFPN